MTKILVIEDEQPLREEIMDWLMFEGYDCVEAADGQAGLQAALQFQPDAILCDIMMPYLDGYGVLMEVQGRPQLVDTVFIFMTAKTAYEDVRRGMTLGVDDYLTKPFRREELLQAIQAQIAKKQLRRQEYQLQIETLMDRLAQEQESLVLRERVVAMLVHDFRNPISGIISSTNLLKTYGARFTEEERIIRLDRIERSAYCLTEMLEEVLLTAQMESGNLVFNPDMLDLGRFLEEITQDFESVSQGSHQFAVQREPLPFIKADPRLVKHLLMNLISNAVKYSPMNSRIELTLRLTPDGVLLTVRDEGYGIPADDLPHIFEAFHRAKNTQHIKGTGLGLAMIKKVVELHGWLIEVSSRVNEGSEFQILIPMERMS